MMKLNRKKLKIIITSIILSDEFIFSCSFAFLLLIALPFISLRNINIESWAIPYLFIVMTLPILFFRLFAFLRSQRARKYKAEKEQLEKSLMRAEFLLRSKSIELREKNIRQIEMLERLKHLQQQLSIKERLASLGVFSSGLSYELRAPLTGIVNGATIIEQIVAEMKQKLRKDNLEDIEKYCHTIQELSQSAGKIISALEKRNELGLEGHELINAHTLVDNVLDELRYARGDERFIHTTIKKMIPKECLFLANPITLSTALYNLIDNSLDAIEERMVSDEKDYKGHIEINFRKRKNEIVINIYDNGIGLTKENRKKLFTPLFTTKCHIQNQGLGLCIISDALSHEQGTISIDSEEKSFTHVIIKLPINEESSQQAS